VCCSGFPGSTARDLRIGSNMDSTTQEGSGRDHDGSPREPSTLQCLDALNAATCLVENEASDSPLDAMQRRMLL
jgi:hypothetical protein